MGDSLAPPAIDRSNNNKSKSDTGVSKHLHEQAYYKGYRDFVHGKLDDPYKKGTEFSKEWQRGQNAAYFKNLELLKSGALLRIYYGKMKGKKVKAPSKK